MDEQLKIQHIDIEYGVTVCAIPSGKVPNLVAEIHAGHGMYCPWGKEERLEAYKGIKSLAEKVIAEMEAGA